MTELFWIVGLITSIKLVKKYESSYQKKVFFFLTIFCSFGTILGISEILSLVSTDIYDIYLSNNQLITQFASLLLSIIYFIYSFSLFNMTELNHTSYIEKILMIILIIVSFLIVLLVRYTLPSDTSLADSIIFIAPIFLGIFSITLTIPTIYSYFETNFKFSYLSMAIGYLTLLVIHFMWVVDDISYENRILLNYWGVGAIILSIIVHNHTLENHKLFVRRETKVSGYKALNDKQRLRSSFIKIWQVILFSFKYVNGTRVTQILQDKINSISATKNYGIALLSDNVGDRISDNVSILELSSIYQSVFSFGIKYISEITGKQFVHEVLEMGYNQLFWAEREVIDNYIFKGGGFASLIDKEFFTTKKNYAQLLKELPIFQGLENDEIRMILSRASFQSFEPDEIIVKQGEPAVYFYILIAGEIEVLKKDAGSLPKLVDHLGPSAYFGELAILRNTVRAATCKAVTNVEVMAFVKEDFNDFIAKYLRISNLIEENYDLHILLHQMPLFSELLPYQLEQIIKKLKHQEYPPSTTIFSQGEMGDCFYIVKKGELDITVEMNGVENVVAKLSKGEYFGEIALMNRSPRTSTVKSVTKTTLLVLALEDFEKIMEEMKITASELEKMKSRRLLDLTGKSELQKTA